MRCWPHLAPRLTRQDTLLLEATSPVDILACVIDLHVQDRKTRPPSRYGDTVKCWPV